MVVTNHDELLMNEFQLVELEERLEMVAGSSNVLLDYCCECVGNPFCGEN